MSKEEITGLDHEYLNLFCQPLPHVNVKPKGRDWVKSSHPFNWNQFKKEHFNGVMDYAFLAKWYPGYGVIDADSVPYSFVEDVKGKLGLNDDNSFTFKSESPDSYHVIFRPQYNGKPGTQRLYTDIMQPFAYQHGVEVFPQPHKTIRAPFGQNETLLKPELFGMDWKDYTYWFGKLDEYDLAGVPYSQNFLPLDAPRVSGRIPAYKIGEDYLIGGLQHPSEREYAQFHVLYYLWRKNVPMDTAIETTYEWLKRGHNGMSQEVNTGNWRQIKKHIQRQAARIYSYYTLPDEAHNTFHGFLTKDDIPHIFRIAEGKLSKAKFLFNLVKYFYPRRMRKSSPVHRDLLVEWSSSHTYQKRLNELEEAKLIRRDTFYIIGQRSKNIILNWEYSHPSKAILIDNRTPDTLEETLRISTEREELRAILKQSGMDRGNISKYLKQVYGETPTRVNDSFPMPST